MTYTVYNLQDRKGKKKTIRGYTGAALKRQVPVVSQNTGGVLPGLFQENDENRGEGGKGKKSQRETSAGSRGGVRTRSTDWVKNTRDTKSIAIKYNMTVGVILPTVKKRGGGKC